MSISIRTIHTRGRREAREHWDVASDDALPIHQRRNAYRKFLQRIDMLPKGSMADINVTPPKLRALEALLEMTPDCADRRRRAALGKLTLAMLLVFLFGLAFSVSSE